MKILRVTHTFNPEVGGPIESVRQSTLELLKRGHEVTTISLDAPDSPWVKTAPFPVHAVGPARGSYGYTAELTRWVTRERARFDVVIAHGLWQYTSFGIWRALHRTKTPYVIFPHGMLDPWFKQAYPLKHIKKLLYWPWGEYRVLRDAAAVLFTSEEERRLARQSFAPYHCREVVVSYGTAAPAVDWEKARLEFFAKFPQLEGKRFLLFLGRLHDKKGCDLLLEAFADFQKRNSEFSLVMAGPCASENYLAKLKATAGESVLFAGMLSGNLKWGALSAADAFVLPSHQENFGIAVVEALACGTPVLISNKVNIWREIVEDGSGFADDDTREGVTRLLEKWQMTSAEERREMRERARDCFRRRFEIERATDSLLRALTDVSRTK